MQSGTANVSTTGLLNLSATAGSIGASGAGNSILTNVGQLSASAANDVYISNSGTATMTLESVSSTSGAVNISTVGPLTTATSTTLQCGPLPLYPCTVNFSGASITLVSGGNMTIGSNYTFAGNAGGGAAQYIDLYAGFTETPGSAPVSNFSFSTLNLASTFNANTVNLWANQQADYSGQANATFSNPAQVFYNPNPSPIDVYVLGSTVVEKTYDGVTTATITGGTLSGVPAEYLAGVTLTQSGTFATANIGNSIAVTATDVLNVAPGLAGDFLLIEPTGLTGTILPANVTPTGLQLQQFPKVGTGIQSYIAGLNLTSGNVQGGNHSGNSGSGYTYTFNTGLSEYDKPNKLYCN